MKIKTLLDNSWVSLKSIQNEDEWGPGEYVFSHETRCKGEIIAVMPYRFDGDDISFLLRSEITPCWGVNPCISSITGGVEEGLSPAETTMHELEEEAGLIVTADELIPLGACRGTKSTDTVYHLFACDVTKKRRGEAKGDGSYLEKIAHCFWSKNVHDAVDPLVFTLVYRLLLLLDTLEGEQR